MTKAKPKRKPDAETKTAIDRAIAKTDGNAWIERKQQISWAICMQCDPSYGDDGNKLVINALAAYAGQAMKLSETRLRELVTETRIAMILLMSSQLGFVRSQLADLQESLQFWTFELGGLARKQTQG